MADHKSCNECGKQGALYRLGKKSEPAVAWLCRDCHPDHPRDEVAERIAEDE